MSEKIASWARKIISLCFYLLFFFVPLIVTPFNFELFEYNKMMLTYALTLIIATSWIIKMLTNREIQIRSTPFDIPLLLFALSQTISTIFSIDRHLSLFGYYSRFNGGLLSIGTYVTLYYAFVSNIKKENIKKYLLVGLCSAVLVCLYAVLERLGIDKHIWIQDVQNRVFSTLGQPNWLAAYLAILIPISIGLGLSKLNKLEIKNWKLDISLLAYWSIGLLFYLTLIFTKSRSGFIGLWIANGAFWLILFLMFKKHILKLFIILNSCFIILNFFFGTPFEPVNRFTLPSIISQPRPKDDRPLADTTPLLETGITESGDIRRIVWKGALDILKDHPLFGTGTETFAFAYYKYRPAEHNMTSEWDFLYNKAHNEYLNYAATTGFVGIGTYLLFIAVVVMWNLKNFLIKNKKFDIGYLILEIGLFAGWLAILITNFLGFSVVIVQIYFFLIPAINVLIENQKEKTLKFSFARRLLLQRVILLATLLLFFFLAYRLITAYIADYYYAAGYQEGKAGRYLDSYQSLSQALVLNPREVLYYDELSLSAAALSLAAFKQDEATLASQLKTQAIAASNFAISTSPNNVSFYKTRTRVFYELAQIDPVYLKQSIAALQIAFSLSPTDPKLAYNLGLMYGKDEQSDKAIEYLQKSANLKPNYREAHIALALYYIEAKEPEKARKSAQFILDKINPGDSDAQSILDQLSK